MNAFLLEMELDIDALFVWLLESYEEMLQAECWHYTLKAFCDSAEMWIIHGVLSMD